MEISKYEAFLAAADTGSLTAAAEILGYTQSGITRMINSLEEELGFSLFIRSKKGVILTANGQMMIPTFRDAVRAFQNVGEAGAEIRGSVRGTITIGSYYSIAALWLPKLLKGFQSLYPGIKISLREGGNLDMNKWLSEKSIDLCFSAKPKSNEYDWVEILKDEMVVWLPKNHSAAKKSSFPVKDLEKELFIHTSPGKDTEIDRLLEEQNLRPNTTYSTKDAFTTYNMVAAGLGVSCNQRLISRRWSKDIVTVGFSPKQYISLGIVAPSFNDVSPASKKFIQYVKSKMKELI